MQLCTLSKPWFLLIINPTHNNFLLICLVFIWSSVVIIPIVFSIQQNTFHLISYHANQSIAHLPLLFLVIMLSCITGRHLSVNQHNYLRNYSTSNFHQICGVAEVRLLNVILSTLYHLQLEGNGENAAFLKDAISKEISSLCGIRKDSC